MPTPAEILDLRNVTDFIGQRFGLDSRSLGKHDQQAQTVVEIVAVLKPEEGKVAVDVLGTKVVRTDDNTHRAVVSEKKGRRILYLDNEEVR